MLDYVERIDHAYNLVTAEPHQLAESEIAESSSPRIPPKIPQEKIVKIFVSSTFLDMKSERDLLIKFVYPELKRRAAELEISLLWIDLRWGLPSESQYQK